MKNFEVARLFARRSPPDTARRLAIKTVDERRSRRLVGTAAAEGRAGGGNGCVPTAGPRAPKRQRRALRPSDLLVLKRLAQLVLELLDTLLECPETVGQLGQLLEPAAGLPGTSGIGQPAELFLERLDEATPPGLDVLQGSIRAAA